MMFNIVEYLHSNTFGIWVNALKPSPELRKFSTVALYIVSYARRTR